VADDITVYLPVLEDFQKAVHNNEVLDAQTALKQIQSLVTGSQPDFGAAPGAQALATAYVTAGHAMQTNVQTLLKLLQDLGAGMGKIVTQYQKAIQGDQISATSVQNALTGVDQDFTR
jgi:hypothetical protein